MTIRFACCGHEVAVKSLLEAALAVVEHEPNVAARYHLEAVIILDGELIAFVNRGAVYADGGVMIPTRLQ